jgi:sRNA-binding regulator protein Hfq
MPVQVSKHVINGCQIKGIKGISSMPCIMVMIEEAIGVIYDHATVLIKDEQAIMLIQAEHVVMLNMTEGAAAELIMADQGASSSWLDKLLCSLCMAYNMTGIHGPTSKS